MAAVHRKKVSRSEDCHVRIVVLAVVFFILLVLPRPAHAYIDPGSGSMMLQVLLGGAAAAIVGIRAFWTRVAGRFRLRGPGRS
jgi:hypothetical protein